MVVYSHCAPSGCGSTLSSLRCTINNEGTSADMRAPSLMTPIIYIWTPWRFEPAALDWESHSSSLKYQNPVFHVGVERILSAPGLVCLFHSCAGEHEQLKPPLLIFFFFNEKIPVWDFWGSKRAIRSISSEGAVGGHRSSAWQLAYLFRAHPLHLCHYQQRQCQKGKQKEKHLLMTAPTPRRRESKTPLIESWLGESRCVICINISACAPRSSSTKLQDRRLVDAVHLQQEANPRRSDDPKKTPASGGEYLLLTEIHGPFTAASFPWKRTGCLISADQMCFREIKAATDYALWPFCPGAFWQWSLL